MNVTKINAISPNYNTNKALAFRAKEDDDEKRSLTAKKWGVGIASFLAPGSGQIINSEVGKGIALLIPGIILFSYNMTKYKEGVTPIISSLVLLALKLYSTIDAVSKTKPDKE